MIQNADLIALFASGAPYVMADLYTITLLNGTVIRITSADIPLPVAGHTFSTTPLMSRSSVKLIAGLEVDSQSVVFYPSDSDTIGSLTFAAAAFRGLLDNAGYLHERAFFSPDYNTYVSKIIRFSGTVQDIQAGGRSQIPMTIVSDLFLLNVKLPSDVYQPGCRRVLYDTGCAVVKASFGVTSSAISGSTTTLINCGLTQLGGSFGTFTGVAFGTGDGSTGSFSEYVTAFPVEVSAVYFNRVSQPNGWGYTMAGLDVTINFPSAVPTGVVITADVVYSQSGWFDLGTVTFTSGANNGISRTVKSYAPGVLNFSLPWPYTPAPGDTFTAYPGCDKMQATCRGKFNNVGRFSSEPFIPVAEVAF